MTIDIFVPKIRERTIELGKIEAGLGGIFKKVEAFKGREVKGFPLPESWNVIDRKTGQVLQSFMSEGAMNSWLAARPALCKTANIEHVPERARVIEIPGSRHKLAAMPNLITNNGLDSKGGGPDNFLSACHVGTGTTPEAVGDSALGSYYASNNSTVSTTLGARSSAPYYGYQTRVYRFNPPGVSKNYTELGISQTSGQTDLFARALTKVGGSPAAISVQADEWLDVTYECRLYPYAVSQDVDGGTVDGYALTYGAVDVDHTYPAGWADVIDAKMSVNFPGSSTRVSAYANANFNGPLEYPLGTGLGTLSGTAAIPGSYSNGAYAIDIQYQAGLSEINGQINMLMHYSNLGRLAFRCSPYINKTGSDVLNWTIHYTWTRKSI